eukprot:COSAG01_NODE_558_length_15478_cov_217.596788_11_plen_173_part_00
MRTDPAVAHLHVAPLLAHLVLGGRLRASADRGEHGPAVLAQQRSESLLDRTDGPRSAAVVRQPTPRKDKCKACHGGAGGGGEARSRAPGDAARPRYCQGRGSMHRPTVRRAAAVGEPAKRRCDGAGWAKVIGVRTILPLSPNCPGLSSWYPNRWLSVLCVIHNPSSIVIRDS